MSSGFFFGIKTPSSTVVEPKILFNMYISNFRVIKFSIFEKDNARFNLTYKVILFHI